jgi:hypothetical protein
MIAEFVANGHEIVIPKFKIIRDGNQTIYIRVDYGLLEE